MIQVAEENTEDVNATETKIERLRHEAAIAWVMEAFKPMIRMKEKVKGIYFVEITSTKKTRQAGLTDMGQGWRRIVSQPVEEVALSHIDIILRPGLSKVEKIEAIIEKEKADDAETQRYTQAWSYVDIEKLCTHIIK